MHNNNGHDNFTPCVSGADKPELDELEALKSTAGETEFVSHDTINWD